MWRIRKRVAARLLSGRVATGCAFLGSVSGMEMSERVTPVDLRDYTQVISGQVSTTRVYATEKLTTEVWCVPPRVASDVTHFATQDSVLTVISGRCRVVTDDGTVLLDPLGAVLISADTMFGVENASADPVVLIVQRSPGGEKASDPPVVKTDAAVIPPRPKRRLFRTGS